MVNILCQFYHQYFHWLSKFSLASMGNIWKLIWYYSVCVWKVHLSWCFRGCSCSYHHCYHQCKLMRINRYATILISIGVHHLLYIFILKAVFADTFRCFCPLLCNAIVVDDRHLLELIAFLHWHLSLRECVCSLLILLHGRFGFFFRIHAHAHTHAQSNWIAN